MHNNIYMDNLTNKLSIGPAQSDKKVRHRHCILFNVIAPVLLVSTKRNLGLLQFRSLITAVCYVEAFTKLV